jgi:hypothetical protein
MLVKQKREMVELREKIRDYDTKILFNQRPSF